MDQEQELSHDVEQKTNLKKSYINMNSDAEIYASKNNFQSLIVKKILDQWAYDNVNPLFYGDDQTQIDNNRFYRILDIGAGDGGVSIMLHNTILNSKNGLYGETLGIDMHQEMVDFANTRLTTIINDRQWGSNKNKISFKLGNICDIDSIPKEWLHSFDLVVSFNCMHWVENQVETLTHIVKLLKPNGKCFMVFSGERIEAMIHATNKIFEIQDHLKNNNITQLIKMLPPNDFTINEISIIYSILDNYINDLKKIDEEMKFPWRKQHMMANNPGKLYENFMMKAGFKEANVIPLKNLRFICLPSKEYMHKVHISIFPNLHKVAEAKLKERFVELYNLFCFDYNFKNHDSYVNHLSPEHYVISKV